MRMSDAPYFLATAMISSRRLMMSALLIIMTFYPMLPFYVVVCQSI